VLDERRLRDLAERLVRVPGVQAVALGGSRARGDHTAESDVDLGLYYRAPLDVEAVGEVARAVAGPQAEVTAPGAWGPWVTAAAGFGAGEDELYATLTAAQHLLDDTARHCRPT
jgi:Nucleotidyltransferase domain